MYGAIAANKRNTFFIMVVFIGLITGIGYVVSALYGNTSITWWILIGAAIYALIQYFLAAKLATAMTGAKQIEKKDNPRLFRIVENLSITLGLPMPKVYVINDPAPNAFATGRNPQHAIVAATTGLMEIMDDNELEAVMAHEMGHVQNYDIRVSMIAFGLVSAIGLLADIVMNTLFWGGDRREGNNPIVLIIGLVIVVLAPIIALIVQMAISRQREYLADASGAMTTRDSESLAKALEKLQSYGRPMKHQNSATAHLFSAILSEAVFFNKLFSSHPPLEDRIKRLRQNAENSKSGFRATYESQKARTSQRIRGYLHRRPHRSFTMTRRRDYVRSLSLPGYFRFTKDVTNVLWRYKKLFFSLAIVYAVLFFLLIGLGSQETYSQLSQTLRDTSNNAFEGNWGQIEQAGLLFASLATTGLSSGLAIEQQIYSVLLALMVWLTTIWLLRQSLAGHRVKLRDGLYNAGAPLVPTFLLALVLVIQLLPAAIAGVGYGAASASGLLQGGIEAMLFWIAAGLAFLLSLYWIASTFFAMIMVTLPGTYPLHALRTAGDMVIGRRIRILLRLGWALLVVAVGWAIILIPVILFDGWIKSVWTAIDWLPLVPIILLTLTISGLIWSTAYVYLLYRKVIDDDASPA